MKRKIMDIIVCPECHSEFKLKAFEKEGTEIVSGIVECKNCDAWYPIVNSVLRVVSSDIYDRSAFERKFSDKLVGLGQTVRAHIKKHKSTIDTFEKEWSNYQQFGYNKNIHDFMRKTGASKGSLKGKLVLDVGCGNGRFSVAAKECGAKEVVGIDLINSIDKTYSRLKDDGFHAIQADIFNLPFKDNVFDFIFSIGVLHHTQNTQKAFLGLPIFLKKGGRISCTFYKKMGIVREFTDDFIRFFTTRMPQSLVWYLSYIPTYLAKALHLIPVLKKGKRWVCLDEVIFATIVHIRPEHSICFDWWSPKIATRQSWCTVKKWYQQAGLKNIDKLDYGAVAYTATK